MVWLEHCEQLRCRIRALISSCSEDMLSLCWAASDSQKSEHVRATSLRCPARGYSVLLEVTSSTLIFTVLWPVNAPAGRICPAAVCTTSCILFVKRASGTWSLTKLKRWLHCAWEPGLGRMKHWEGLARRWVLQKPPLALQPALVCGAAAGQEVGGCAVNALSLELRVYGLAIEQEEMSDPAWAFCCVWAAAGDVWSCQFCS